MSSTHRFLVLLRASSMQLRACQLDVFLLLKVTELMTLQEIQKQGKCFTCRPEPMKPVERLSHRLSLTPVSSHSHESGLLGMWRPHRPIPFSSCGRSAAYWLCLRSSSQADVSSWSVAESCACHCIEFVNDFLEVEDSILIQGEMQGQTATRLSTLQRFLYTG